MSEAIMAPAMPVSGYGVPLTARICRCLFGNPSVTRAHGKAEALPAGVLTQRPSGAQKRKATPVYALDRRMFDRKESLPRIWVTEPYCNLKTGETEGRAFVGVYPMDGDADGSRALSMAEAYWGEALGYTAAEDMELRAECFRAAEVLYMHAAGRGRIDAYEKLGLLYRNDYGAGRYWTFGLGQGRRTANDIDIRRRAVECFGYAASHGRGESCLYMAEMLAEGGADENQIILLLRRAFDVAGGIRHIPRGGSEMIAHGLAALALAKAHESGLGCEQSFELALGWYTYAKDDLEAAVDEGLWKYKRQAHTADVGVRRMMQEIFGGR